MGPCCHCGAKAEWWAGRVSCIGCPKSFCAGDNPSRREGVFLYCNRARTSFSAFMWFRAQAPSMIFFIDFTADSALPLLCGYVGDDVMCWNPHS